MNKKLLSLICLLTISSGLQAMLALAGGQGAGAANHWNISGSRLAEAQLRMHPGLVDSALLGKTKFIVGQRECSEDENSTIGRALEQLSAVPERVGPEDSESFTSNLDFLVRTVCDLPEATNIVLGKLHASPERYAHLYPAFVKAIQHKAKHSRTELTENEIASLKKLHKQLNDMWGGDYLEEKTAINAVFNDNLTNFTQRIQTEEPWVRRNWGKFAAFVGATGFVARPYVEAGVRHTARVGVRVAMQQLISKFTGGDSTTADAGATPPAAE